MEKYAQILLDYDNAQILLDYDNIFLRTKIWLKILMEDITLKCEVQNFWKYDDWGT